jgi:DNA helicase-2/ATP-dependent DNA helicase PcrA
MQQVLFDNDPDAPGGPHPGKTSGILDELNPDQRAAVTAPDGPTLVLAGAGTGKTRVLAHRVAWLVHDRRVHPRSIIALTFTNKAAGEMRERIGSLLDAKARAWVGTFHTFGLWILRRHREAAGLPLDFAVCGVSEQLDIVKRGMKKHELPTDRFKPRGLLQDIQWVKNYDAVKEEGGESGITFMPHISDLYGFYKKYCVANGLVDFTDLLVRPLVLFGANPDIRERYQDRCEHLLIDEYQDTNQVQFNLASLLTKKHRNLFAVGDEDQSIYGWRGADMRNVTQFKKSFPDGDVLRLEQNYRSTQNILDTANSLIKNNQERIGKQLWTDTGSGDHVVFHRTADAEAEAHWVADRITEMDRPRGDCAILFRTNAQSREFESAFVLRGIPYEIVAGTRFYDRREIKDVLGYLRVAVRPEDDLSLTRVLTAGAYGIGPKTIEQARNASGSLSLFESLRSISHLSSVQKFVAFVEKLHGSMKNRDVVEAVEAVIKASGYLKKLEAGRPAENRERIENVKELVNAVREYADEDPNATLMGFLNDVALMSDVDSWHEGERGVSLMTVHAAKGLEFPVVFVVGLEEGLMPHASSIRDGNVEEERRLCYVAMTRAREKLYLTAAHERMVFGVTRSTNLSRFMGELQQDGLEVYSSGNELPGVGSGRPRDGVEKMLETESVHELRVGTRVRHRQFGVGTVLYSVGKGKRAKVKVQFGKSGVRQFMVAYAKFEVLG